MSTEAESPTRIFIATNVARDPGGESRGCNGGGDTWADSRSILKFEPTGFANGWNLWFERKNGVQDRSKVQLTGKAGCQELRQETLGKGAVLVGAGGEQSLGSSL